MPNKSAFHLDAALTRRTEEVRRAYLDVGRNSMQSWPHSVDEEVKWGVYLAVALFTPCDLVSVDLVKNLAAMWNNFVEENDLLCPTIEVNSEQNSNGKY